VDDICKSRSTAVLLVEAKDDCHVVLALAKLHNLPEGAFGVHECAGTDGVLKRLNALIIAPDTDRPKTMGVLMDADDSVANRWRQLAAKLKLHGYDLPALPDPNGTVLEGSENKPRVGIWIMPNNSEVGMIEDFLLESLSADALNTASDAVNSARGKEFCTFKQVHYVKAVVHTYLAWQDEPGRPLGQSVTTGVLRGDTPTALKFVDWLRRLFS
jgi:hypothetical protein